MSGSSSGNRVADGTTNAKVSITPLYDESKVTVWKWDPAPHTFALAGAAVLAVLTVIAYSHSPAHLPPVRLYWATCGWAILPPLWFWAEFFFIFPSFGRPETFDSFKEGQKVCIAVWAPIALSLGAFSNSDYFKPLPSPSPNTACSSGEVPTVPASSLSQPAQNH
jgi:hypothetical protein